LVRNGTNILLTVASPFNTLCQICGSVVAFLMVGDVLQLRNESFFGVTITGEPTAITNTQPAYISFIQLT
jgi:hypothetical protein